MKTSFFVGVCALTITAYAGAAPNAKPAGATGEKSGNSQTGSVGKTPASSTAGTSSAASTSDGNATLTTTSSAPAQASSVYGILELRPTGQNNNGNYRFENSTEIGYKFSSTSKIRYVQWWNTNLGPNKGGPTGLDAQLDDGHINHKSDKIVEFDKNNYLSYEGRYFVPTAAGRREAGFLTYTRQYLKFGHKFGDAVTMELREAPSYYFYTRPGHAGKSNPSFENHIVLNTDFHITKNVTFSIPIYHWITRYRAGGGDLDNKWGYKLVVWPEVSWDITPNHTVGVAYRSASLISSNHATNFDEGFKTGVWQVLYSLTL